MIEMTAWPKGDRTNVWLKRQCVSLKRYQKAQVRLIKATDVAKDSTMSHGRAISRLYSGIRKSGAAASEEFVRT